jgi:predicted dehydrogenase
MTTKRIGFVDYRLDNFHANVYLAALRGPLVQRGYKVVGATALEAEPSRRWAEEKQMAYYDSVDALAKDVDFFMILAPSNPEVHLSLCQATFPQGKQTFVDKTFAPDLATAQAIFALADSCGIAIQSTSALRSTNVQGKLRELPTSLQSMFITSSGPTFEEYGIHPIELAVSCLGAEVLSVLAMGSVAHPQYVLRYADGRTAIIDFNSAAEVPYTAELIAQDSCLQVEVDTSNLFVDAAAAILDFFDAGVALIDPRETLVIRQILDCLTGELPGGQFVELSGISRTEASLSGPHWSRSTTRVGTQVLERDRR